jgi:hypothetical protein
MKKLISLTYIMIALVIISCSGDKKESQTSTEETTTVDSTSQPMMADSNQINSIPVDMNHPDVPAGTPPAQPAAATAEGMNPAHGEPGHRCDIAVGAPLSSPPGKVNDAPATITSSPVSTPVPAPQNITIDPQQNQTITVDPTKDQQPTITAPGMNPPHGQPGHDCSIAVGAPLKK